MFQTDNVRYFQNLFSPIHYIIVEVIEGLQLVAFLCRSPDSSFLCALIYTHQYEHWTWTPSLILSLGYNLDLSAQSLVSCSNACLFDWKMHQKPYTSTLAWILVALTQPGMKVKVWCFCFLDLHISFFSFVKIRPSFRFQGNLCKTKNNIKRDLEVNKDAAKSQSSFLTWHCKLQVLQNHLGFPLLCLSPFSLAICLQQDTACAKGCLGLNKTSQRSWCGLRPRTWQCPCPCISAFFLSAQTGGAQSAIWEQSQARCPQHCPWEVSGDCWLAGPSTIPVLTGIVRRVLTDRAYSHVPVLHPGSQAYFLV